MSDIFYAASIVLGSQCLSLIQVGSDSADSRRFEVRSGRQILGEIRTLASVFPSYSVGFQGEATDLVIWAESDVYLVSLHPGQIFHHDHFDAVQAVYLHRETCCLIGDASVTVIDLPGGVEIARYEHDEVLISSSWRGQDLIVEDLQGRSFRFEQLQVNPTSLEQGPLSDY